MKVLKKIGKVMAKIGKVLLIIILAITLIAVVGLNYKTIAASHKNKDVLAAAKSMKDISVPDNVKILGLGEGSHGAVQFQESKKEVFDILVERHGYKAIVLEADFADCLEANAYVQGGEGDAREIVNRMSFVIYHTQQMADLLDWMREYNAAVPETERLRIYGFDIQNPEKGFEFLTDYMNKNNISGIDVSAIEYLVDENRQERLTDEDAQKVKNELAEIRKAIEGKEGEDFDFDTTCAIKVTQNMETCLGYMMVNVVNAEMSAFRDRAMADNVSWILDLEKEIGAGKIMLAAHNGHIGKKGQNITLITTMGKELKDKYGDEYYSLGTDFFKGTINSSVIRTTPDDEYQRKDYYLTTADPIAYQAKYMDDKRLYIDFESISPENDKAIYDLVNSNMTTGSIGEGFYGLCYLVHASYRLEEKPTDLYDGMLFYYEVNPIAPTY